MNTPQLRVLYFEGCPKHQPCVDLVHEVVTDFGSPVDVEQVRVDDPAQAGKLGFHGSPTVQVNGTDVESTPAGPQGESLSCRLYSTPDGLPARDTILRALREASRS